MSRASTAAKQNRENLEKNRSQAVVLPAIPRPATPRSQAINYLIGALLPIINFIGCNNVFPFSHCRC